MTRPASDPRPALRLSPIFFALAAGLLAGAAWAQPSPAAAPGAEAAASAVEPMPAAASQPASAATPTPTPPPAALPSPAPVPAAVKPLNPGADWQALSPLQRQVLAPLEQEWTGLDATRRSKWLELVARYPQLPADEQQRVQERMNTWAKLSPAERQQARVGFQVAQQLKADERQAKWEAYQALPAERRQELADKAAHKLAQGQPALAPRPAEAKQAPNPGAKSNLVLLLPRAADQPDQPLGPTVLQAKPGATTVLITEGKSPWQRPIARSQLRLDLSRLDDKTLLPKPAKTP